MHEYVFDLRMWVTARVQARTESEARDKLARVADCLDLALATPEGVTLTEASHCGEPFSLIEMDGEICGF